MIQHDTAREIAQAFGFRIETRASPGDIQAVLVDAAAAAGTGGLKGTLRQVGSRFDEGHLVSKWVLKGPGGHVQILDFEVRAAPLSATVGLFEVVMEIGNFRCQKGLLFAPPTLSGGNVVRKFNRLVRAGLAVGTGPISRHERPGRSVVASHEAS
jgi:hypothetical protein